VRTLAVPRVSLPYLRHRALKAGRHGSGAADGPLNYGTMPSFRQGEVGKTGSRAVELCFSHALGSPQPTGRPVKAANMKRPGGSISAPTAGQLGWPDPPSPATRRWVLPHRAARGEGGRHSEGKAGCRTGHRAGRTGSHSSSLSCHADFAQRTIRQLFIKPGRYWRLKQTYRQRPMHYKGQSRHSLEHHGAPPAEYGEQWYREI